MIKPFTLVTSISSLLLCASTSFATDPSPAALSQLQQQIDQLQAQINVLQPPRLAFDSQNPLAALSTPNLAYSLLQQQALYPATATLGGSLSAAAQTWNGSQLDHTIGQSTYPTSGSAIAATGAELDFLANITSWSQTFATLNGGLDGYTTNFSEGFITIGNLRKTPWYATLGETYLPFGDFPGNGLVANTPETNAFKSAELGQLDLGFGRDGFNMVLALFKGASGLNDFVYSAQYTATLKRWTLSAGAGYLNDIRYSGNDIAAAYDLSNSRDNTLSDELKGGRNPAVNLNSTVNYTLTATQSLSGAAEWSTTTHSAIVVDQEPGKMQAWTLTGSYNTLVLHSSTTFALSYSATLHMDAVPLQLPGPVNQTNVSAAGMRNQWLAYAESELYPNVYVGPEFAWINLTEDRHTWEAATSASLYF